MKLYYKRLLDRGLSSLTIYKDYKQHKRNNRSGSRSPAYIGSRGQSLSPRDMSKMAGGIGEHINVARIDAPSTGDRRHEEQMANMMSETSQF